MSERAFLLDEAKKFVTKERNNSYGEPDQDFQRIATLWHWYLEQLPDRSLKAHDVAIMMILLKISRLTWSPGHFDSWADIAGYAACGWECAKINEGKSIQRRDRVDSNNEGAGTVRMDAQPRYPAVPRVVDGTK